MLDLDLQNMQLTQADHMRHQRLSAGLASVQQQEDEGTLDPEEARHLMGQIHGRLQPLNQRIAASGRLQQQIAEQQVQSQVAHQEALQQQNAEYRARNLEKRVAIVTDPVTGRVQHLYEERPQHWASLDWTVGMAETPDVEHGGRHDWGPAPLEGAASSGGQPDQGPLNVEGGASQQGVQDTAGFDNGGLGSGGSYATSEHQGGATAAEPWYSEGPWAPSNGRGMGAAGGQDNDPEPEEAPTDAMLRARYAAQMGTPLTLEQHGQALRDEAAIRHRAWQRRQQRQATAAASQAPAALTRQQIAEETRHHNTRRTELDAVLREMAAERRMPASGWTEANPRPAWATDPAREREEVQRRHNLRLSHLGVPPVTQPPTSSPSASGPGFVDEMRARAREGYLPENPLITAARARYTGTGPSQGGGQPQTGQQRGQQPGRSQAPLAQLQQFERELPNQPAEHRPLRQRLIAEARGLLQARGVEGNYANMTPEQQTRFLDIMRQLRGGAQAPTPIPQRWDQDVQPGFGMSS